MNMVTSPSKRGQVCRPRANLFILGSWIASTSTKSRRVIVMSPHLRFPKTVAEVLSGMHAAFVIREDADSRTLEIDIDHRYVGGSMFYRFVESLVGSAPRELPRSTIVRGFLCAATHARVIMKVQKLP